MSNPLENLDPFSEDMPEAIEAEVKTEIEHLPFVLTPKFFKESYDFNESAAYVAKQRGQVVVYPGPTEIQLDIDSEGQLNEIKLRVERMYQMDIIPNKSLFLIPSKTPGHYHATLDLGVELTEWQRIALQSVLGSDPMREYLNAMRAMSDEPRPTRFFETPPAPEPRNLDHTRGF